MVLFFEKPSYSTLHLRRDVAVEISERTYKAAILHMIFIRRSIFSWDL